jgi:hypothetical protein
MPLFNETAPIASSTAPSAASGVDPAEAQVGQTPDPRVVRVVAELKEILEILSRD